MAAFEKEQIIHYYDTCEKNYKRWWDLDRSLAMHAGYWDKSTKTLHQALIKENEVLAKIANVTAHDKVLDAGCGVGGSSLYLAEHCGCKVVGITLCEKQIAIAQRSATFRKLSHAPEFLVMDYTSTAFSSASFDVVWAIESVCHAKDKRDFIKEAWRLLKPRGRLIVADGFQVRNEYADADKALLDKAVNGWAVDSMESIPNFERFLVEQGFRRIIKQDATKNILPSSFRLFLYSFPAIFISKLGEWFGWSTKTQTQDFVGYHYQFWAVRKKLCRYMIFCAEKPD